MYIGGKPPKWWKKNHNIANEVNRGMLIDNA